MLAECDFSWKCVRIAVIRGKETKILSFWVTRGLFLSFQPPPTFSTGPELIARRNSLPQTNQAGIAQGSTISAIFFFSLLTADIPKPAKILSLKSHVSCPLCCCSFPIFSFSVSFSSQLMLTLGRHAQSLTWTSIMIRIRIQGNETYSLTLHLHNNRVEIDWTYSRYLFIAALQSVSKIRSSLRQQQCSISCTYTLSCSQDAYDPPVPDPFEVMFLLKVQ